MEISQLVYEECLYIMVFPSGQELEDQSQILISHVSIQFPVPGRLNLQRITSLDQSPILVIQAIRLVAL